MIIEKDSKKHAQQQRQIYLITATKLTAARFLDFTPSDRLHNISFKDNKPYII